MLSTEIKKEHYEKLTLNGEITFEELGKYGQISVYDKTFEKMANYIPLEVFEPYHPKDILDSVLIE